jgi:hypothetical protein
MPPAARRAPKDVKGSILPPTFVSFKQGSASPKGALAMTSYTIQWVFGNLIYEAQIISPSLICNIYVSNYQPLSVHSINTNSFRIL